MCGRYVTPSSSEIELHWDIKLNGSIFFKINYNTVPSATVPIIFKTKTGRKKLVMARWGLIPDWWNKKKPPSHSFNARAETAMSKPMWQDNVRKNRCIFPAWGWYEWKTMSQNKIRVKNPYYFQRGKKIPLSFAGTYAIRKTSLDFIEITAAMLTVQSLKGLDEVHNRMPLIIGPNDESHWLKSQEKPTPSLETLTNSLKKQPDLIFYAVNRKVNNPLNNNEALIEPV